jgi:hypothetical protein
MLFLLLALKNLKGKKKENKNPPRGTWNLLVLGHYFYLLG